MSRVPIYELPFSLRTMFVVVSLAGLGFGWIGYQHDIVQRRRAMCEWMQMEDRHVFPGGAFQLTDGSMLNADSSVSWVPRLMGDQPVPVLMVLGGEYRRSDTGKVCFFPDLETRKAAEIAALFPESVWVDGSVMLARPLSNMNDYPETGWPAAPGYSWKSRLRSWVVPRPEPAVETELEMR